MVLILPRRSENALLWAHGNCAAPGGSVGTTGRERGKRRAASRGEGEQHLLVVQKCPLCSLVKEGSFSDAFNAVRG